jgi:hypothetical protein
MIAGPLVRGHDHDEHHDAWGLVVMAATLLAS